MSHIHHICNFYTCLFNWLPVNGKVVCLMQRAELVHRVDPMEKLIQFSWSVIEQDRADIIITDIVGTTNQHSWALTSLNSGLFPDISWIKRKLKCGFCLRHSFSTALWFRPSQYSHSMAPRTLRQLLLSPFWTHLSVMKSQIRYHGVIALEQLHFS